MARPLRIEFDGAWYHVTNRGAGGRRVFPSERDGAFFLGLLGDLSERFGVEVHAYCLIDDHYQLLLHTPRSNLGRAMRHLNGVYTQHHNRRHGQDGSLFRGRYKAILVDPEQYLERLGRYIHNHPLETQAVARAEYYRWSSYRAYIGRAEAPPWLHREAILKRFGGVRYRAYVDEGVDEELRAFFGRPRPGPILGDAAFRARARRLLGDRADQREVPESRRVLARPSLARVARLTAAAFGVDRQELYVVRRGRGAGNVARMVALALGRDLGGQPLGEIARHFGLGHYSSVTAAASRLERRMRGDAALAATVAKLRDRLANFPI